MARSVVKLHLASNVIARPEHSAENVWPESNSGRTSRIPFQLAGNL